MSCHETFNGGCVSCLQRKLLETTDLAKRAVLAAERLSAELKHTKLCVEALCIYSSITEAEYEVICGKPMGGQ